MNPKYIVRIQRWKLRLLGRYTHFNLGMAMAPKLVRYFGDGPVGFAMTVERVGYSRGAHPAVREFNAGLKTWLVENQYKFVPEYMRGQ